MSLIDSSFSTCITNDLFRAYLGGIAVANNVPQNSLHDFELKLFCVEDFASLISIGIDYEVTPKSLTGNLVFLEDGIIRRTGPGFNYFAVANLDLQTNEVSGFYSGARLYDGGQQKLHIQCSVEGSCDIIVWAGINYECITGPDSRFVFNGIAVAKGVSVDSLDSFYADLYCTPPEAGVEIDYTEAPDKTFTPRF